MTEYKTYTNEEGEEVEGLSKQEFEAANQKQTEEFEAQKAELNEKLKKYEGKEFNFKALRDKTKEEREKFLEQLDEKDKRFFLETENNSKNIDNLRGSLAEENKEVALEALCGDDEELRKKVLANFELINIETETKKEVIDKIKKAYNMSVDVSERNPILSASISTNEGDITRRSKEPLSHDAKEVGKLMGVSEEDIKKYGK